MQCKTTVCDPSIKSFNTNVKSANRNNSTPTIIVSEQLDEAKLVSSGCICVSQRYRSAHDSHQVKSTMYTMYSRQEIMHNYKIFSHLTYYKMTISWILNLKNH